MRGRCVAVVSIVGLVSLVASAGCSSTVDEDAGMSEAAATPPSPRTDFDRAQTCAFNYKRHEVVAQSDVTDGVIRWGCGDVPGVTDPDLGQEYCEYHAVQDGKIVTKASELNADGSLDCVFTSVFKDAVNQANPLKAAMAEPENLGVTPASNSIVQMRFGFNTRNAATQLFRDCSRNATATSTMEKRLRSAACYQAYARGGEGAARLLELCKNGNVMTAATWEEAQTLGAKVAAPSEEGYDQQQDIAACMGVSGAGAAWRNSDPMICGRVGRAAADCSCKFNAVPSTLMGIQFQSWNGETLPAGCRFAKVDGADYPFIVICSASPKEVADIPVDAEFSRSVRTFCNKRFAVDLVMTLPFRALQQDGTCAETAGFCASYMHGASPTPQPEPEPTTDTNEEPGEVPNRTVGAPADPTAS